jgi:hypothetical protein
MLLWLWKVFVGTNHQHKWEIIKQVPVRSGGVYAGDAYHLQCTGCGNIKIKQHDY